MKTVFLPLLFLVSFKLFGQTTNSNECSVVWTNSIHIDSNALWLTLTARPFQIRYTLGGDLLASGRSPFTILSSGDLLELSVTKNTSGSNGVASKTIWRYFYHHPAFVAPRDAVVEVVGVRQSENLALLLSDGFGGASSLFLVDPSKEANLIPNEMLLTNKYQFEHNEPKSSDVSICLDQFQNWKIFFKDGIKLESAKQSADLLALNLTNQNGKRFSVKYSGSAKQWHAYSFWGEISRVKK